MESIVTKLAMGGGLFALFAFVHFFVDWIFQSHAEAMVKHNNPKVRAKHCLIYTVGFIPLMYLLGFQTWEWIAGSNILFWSHFVEDTYIPVFLWAKYIRRPPEFKMIGKPPNLDGPFLDNDKDAFIAFIQTTMGKILMIAIDQIIHLFFLFPLVWFALN